MRERLQRLLKGWHHVILDDQLLDLGYQLGDAEGLRDHAILQDTRVRI
jgi:hypothetical protein